MSAPAPPPTSRARVLSEPVGARLQAAGAPGAANADLDTLLHGWLAARSVSRGLPAPRRDCGGWRVDAGLPHEQVRWVFPAIDAGVAAGLAEIGAQVREPAHLIKLCGNAPELLAMLPPRWAMLSLSWFMTRPADGGERSTAADCECPDGHVLACAHEGPVAVVTVRDSHGALVASGRAAQAQGVQVYDQVGTEAAHRRKGLGRAVMSALARAFSDRHARIELLTATDEGRALYESMGWRLLSPYVTAHVPSRIEDAA